MNNEEKILSMLETLTQGQAEMNGRLDRLEAGQAKLEAGQAETNGRLDKLEAGQAKLEAGQAETNDRLDKLEAGQAKLEAGQAKLEAGQAKLQVGQAKLESGLNETKLTVARIEVEHGHKLDALYDGYIMAYDIACATRSDVAVIKERVDMHEIYIKVLDRKVMS